MSANKESWGSRVGLILAMAGNAVGLGNFLRFPVQAVQNGGGAFIIPYLICFLVMGIPLLWIEWSMGRFGGKYGHHSTPFIVDTMGKSRLWKYIGVFGIWTNIAVASYYCYLESWTLSYVFHSVVGTFSDLDQEGVSNFFNTYVSLGKSTFGIPYEPIVFFVGCLLLNTWILSKGLASGVERVAKIGMPLLIFFGIFLAFKGVTIEAGENGASFDSAVGLNFLWTPNFEELWSPTVWLAAAGQIFFTLSVGMGTVQCYASYVRSRDDIALNAMSAGWMNEFVEVVLGGAILIPISIGYLGVDRVTELVQSGGLGLGFRTLPYLFYQWGDFLGALAGFMWFGLLFFAGITSSLAMGTPWIGFLQDEFGWRRKSAAWSFGVIVLVLGMPTVLFFKYGVFDEYDYWAGTVSLVVFALCESILFAWVFGMGNGWREITSGADINVPGFYRFIIKFITPLLLIWVFLGSLFTPLNNDWGKAFAGNWVLDNGSIIKKIMNSGLKEQLAAATDPAQIEMLQDTMFFVNASRILLLGVWLTLALLVYIAYKKRVREGRI
ncbi:sodium-dependent transporter [Botryobacter ruber]|uniref:sodium-dependent transporter n=1 Tax=Botryobacter ruber TaxID=2171629 RepID=UPI000E0C48F2|nr:sodium-dependent transporter [Botryobacter ruber]